MVYSQAMLILLNLRIFFYVDFCSVFERNVGNNAIVSLGYAPFAFYGRNLFIDNKGTSSLRVSSNILYYLL